jgi:uncharacterized protein (DUF2249 family)
LTGIKAGRAAPRQAAGMNVTATATVLDVRTLAPRDRHPTIFQFWDALAEGESFELVNDHDPVPLYYQFACEHTGRFRWEYLERGPRTWRVRLTKGQFADPGFTPKPRPDASPTATPPAAASPAAEAVVLDVRPIFARGETPCGVIDETAARVQPGQRFVLLVPFEPVPLYTKLGRSGFTHLGSRCEDDGTWRIEFLRQATASGAPAACCCGEE